MDAHLKGNVSRFYNHSCSPNVFVQNVFIESWDVRFPWVAFFTATNIKAGTELVWDYSYEVRFSLFLIYHFCFVFFLRLIR
jgi:histone-lysine N-methyltransferase SETDB1